MNQTLWTATAAFVIGGAVRAIKADAFPVTPSARSPGSRSSSGRCPPRLILG